MSRLRYTIRYDAMKCGMLIVVATHACAPAPIRSRSERPLNSNGTNTISDNPPTQRKSTIGDSIDGGRLGMPTVEALLMTRLKGPAAEPDSGDQRPTMRPTHEYGNGAGMEARRKHNGRRAGARRPPGPAN